MDDRLSLASVGTITTLPLRSPIVSDTDPDSDLGASVREIHSRLEATATLPVTESASRWLGEADAVAADAVALLDAADSTDDLPADVLETRLSQVRDLLADVEETGSTDANEHVRAARRLVDEALAEL